MKDNLQNLKFSLFEGPAKVVPTFIEKETLKKFINYGHNNLFPNYLWDLYLRSAILQSIINGTTDYVLGNSINYNREIESLSQNINQDGEILEDIIKKCILDYLIFGGFALQVIRNKKQEITELYWLDFRNIRVDKEETTIFYSDDWVKHSNDYITYEKFNPKLKQENSVFYYKGSLSRGVYPIPSYNGALAAIETSTEISKFHLNSILNNFSGNFIISFNNGQPTEDVQKDIEKKIRDKFTSADNAGKFMLVFNDSKENAVTVERIQDDNFDKKYDALRTSTLKEIFVAFRAVPQLFGFSLEGTGFNKQEFLEAFELYNKTVVIPIQNTITACFNKVFNTNNSVSFEKFNLEV